MDLSERPSRWLWVLGGILFVRLLLMVFLPLTDTSEPRYAEIARLMAETGDWITPWFEPGVPFWGKPPLAFWASALSFRLLGYSDFAARFPAWLATLPTLFLIHRYARHAFNDRTAQLAVLIYASSLLPFVTAGAVLTDAYLTLAVTLSLASFGRLMRDNACPAIWALTFFLGLGLGLLSKGPLTLVMLAGVILPWLCWRRPSAAQLRRLPWASGILMCLAISLPWYGLAEWKTPGFLRYFLLGEHIYRFLDPGWPGDLYGSAHQRAYGAIWLDGLLASLPWGGIALWQFTRWKPSAKPGRGLPADPLRATVIYLLAWALIAPLLFTLSGNILWTYVQPSLPAFSLLLALGLTRSQRPVLGPFSCLALSTLVPLTGIALCVWLTLHPEQLKTEKLLISTYTAHAHADQPLYYLGQRPFSARYYSHGQARLYTGSMPASLLGQHPAGMYLALTPERLESGEGLEGLVLSPVLSKNRKHVLIFAKASKP